MQVETRAFGRCRTMSSRQAVNLDYLYYLQQALLSPLQRSGAEGASEAVQILDNYQLIKEDVDSIMEISVWGNQPEPYSKLDSKVGRSESIRCRQHSFSICWEPNSHC